eukprot:1154663-Pelagomonas_calceolata.AAC.7
MVALLVHAPTLRCGASASKSLDRLCMDLAWSRAKPMTCTRSKSRVLGLQRCTLQIPRHHG